MKEKESATFKIDHDFSDTNFDTAVLQINFAENYSTFYQDEIQLAYWVETQITIFIKRLAGRHVVTGKSIITDSVYFFNAVNNKSKVKVFHVPTAEIKNQISEKSIKELLGNA